MIEEEKHILVFEPLSGGHRSEFISHLAERILRGGLGNRYTFVVAHGLGSAFERRSPDLCIREISPEESQMLANAKGVSGSFKFRKILQSCLDELHPDKLLIMDMTYLELALCFRRLSLPWSAILFVQYPELVSAANPGWKRRLKFQLKEFKTGLLLRNPRLQNMYLLNGKRASAYLNRRFHTARFRALSDPVPIVKAEESFDLRKQYALDPYRVLFLFFGSMSSRKGIDPLVNALRMLPEKTTGQSAFLFCGAPEQGYTSVYRKQMDALEAECPGLKLIRDETFVSNERMRAMFIQADWVLMPYLRPEYSSGILGHAAIARTPVIGPSSGLLGELIRTHGLGLDVEIAPKTLAGAIVDAIETDFVLDENAVCSFVEENRPERFSAVLLEIE